LFRRGDYAGAAAAFDAASHIAARTGQTSARHYSARCEARAVQRIDLDRARALCDRGVRLTDEQASALTSRGFFYFMQGDLNQAAADFARAVEEDPYSAPALYGRGVVAARQGRAEGQGDIARARQMDAFEVDYYANAGLTP
jgi:tetratricopeptide (TPR) repeat protein